MKAKHQRLAWIGTGAAALSLAAFLILNAFDDSLVFFYSPTDLQTKTLQPNQRIRIGGLVEEGSVHRKGQTITFKVTDQQNDLEVSYTGLLPDLFREGQGIVAEGVFITSSHFQAQSVLAKHDENYMPPEVAKSLKDNGVWRHAE